MGSLARPTAVDAPAHAGGFNEDLTRDWTTVHSYVTNRDMEGAEYKIMQLNHAAFLKDTLRKEQLAAAELASQPTGPKGEEEELYLITKQIKADHFEEKHFDSEPPCIDEENFKVKLIDSAAEFDEHMQTK